PLSWPEPEMEVERATAAPTIIREAAGPKELPEAWDFQPETAPYEMIFPSRLAAPQTATQRASGAEAAEGGDTARLRGEVIHRALQTLARGGPLPDTAALAAALRQSGLPAAAATSLAPEMHAELSACQADPFLAALLRPEPPGAASEWLLEDQPRPGTIRRGIIDRLAFDGQDWWILDYKSSRPAAGEDWQGFMAREAEKYRPQLLAYREMAARARGVKPPEAIRLGVYFTACRQVVEM
ncbi:MAG: PD-(D/E)XK nuclease family protein, partial [Desulfobaccales bacterium]